jgi:carboxypeptidase Q
MKAKIILVLIFIPLFSICQQAEKIDTAMVSRIKAIGQNSSNVMEILSYLTDIYGPRLTNSPGYHNAAAYVKSSFNKWGLENVHDDVWDENFGRGWQLKKFSFSAVSPVFYPIIAYPKAWSPSLKGTVKAEAIYLDIQNEEDLEKYKGRLKGKIVLFNPLALITPSFSPDAWRHTDSALLRLANSMPSAAYSSRRFPVKNEPQRLAYMKWSMCEKDGAIAVLEVTPSTRYDGTISVASVTVPYAAEVPYSKRLQPWDPKSPKVLPQLVVSGEHYNRIIRQLKQGQKVNVELNLETEFFPDQPGYNVIAEIPGSDLKEEVVLIGAHLDSWHAGTGTTDNACGVTVMMEAMRILKTIGLTPRRTIRIALWGGEEQGLLGSRNYAKRFFGERLDKYFPYDSIELKPGGKKLSAYFNMDNGAGKYRGIYLQGNEKIAPVFRVWFKPFEKMGASTLTLKNATGTDHLVFDALGIPSFQFIQDPLEYGTRTYHSNTDVYDKAIESDLKHNAIIMAVFAWLAANRDELLPRKD